MCIGDTALDTIEPGEQERLRAAATRQLPGHRFDVRANDDGMTWIVLEPATPKPRLPTPDLSFQQKVAVRGQGA